MGECNSPDDGLELVRGTAEEQRHTNKYIQTYLLL